MQGGERDQLVAVDDRPVAVDREHPVAVAVEGEAGGMAPLAHRLREAFDVGRAAAVVDVAPVGIGREQVDLGAEAPEDLRRGAVRRAVGAVEQHAPAAQVEVGEALVQPAQVVLERAVQAPHGADAARLRGRRVERRLDLDLGVVVELEAVAGEELDAVVAVRVVRGGDDDAEVEPVAADQQWGARRGQDAAEQRLAARGGDAGGHRRLEHLTRLARVADHEHARGARGRRGARRGGAREGQREVGGEELARDSADAVGAEQPAGQPR